ncbi:hypothetical protein OIU76_011813 [Salix suchowensis]|nr:hypothetical protein OIU76_011813 [Salix suchowensis]
MMSSFDPNLFMWKSHFHNGLQSSLIALLSAYFVDGLVFFLCSFLSFFVLGLALVFIFPRVYWVLKNLAYWYYTSDTSGCSFHFLCVLFYF